MILFHDVVKEFSGSDRSTGSALSGVSFHLRKGEFAFLTGHSGSGKTTTLRLAHFAERPNGGHLRVAEFDSRATRARDLWKLRRKVGYIFQDFRLLPGRTAGENIAFVLEAIGQPRARVARRTLELLHMVGIPEKIRAPIRELSGGEQQRVAIARALACDPVLLLADEPTGNLDERATAEIMEIFRDINRKGTAILMATHDLELIRGEDGIRLLELDRGHLVYDSAESGGVP